MSVTYNCFYNNLAQKPPNWTEVCVGRYILFTAINSVCITIAALANVVYILQAP
jgi:hypothetical protein